MPRSEVDRLIDVLFVSEQATEHFRLGRENPTLRDMAMRAVERDLEIIGEAASGLSASLRASSPYDWDQPRGLRNRLAHAYFDLDWTIIGDAVASALPGLLVATENALAALGVSRRRVNAGLTARRRDSARAAEGFGQAP